MSPTQIQKFPFGEINDPSITHLNNNFGFWNNSTSTYNTSTELYLTIKYIRQLFVGVFIIIHNVELYKSSMLWNNNE